MIVVSLSDKVSDNPPDRGRTLVDSSGHRPAGTDRGYLGCAHGALPTYAAGHLHQQASVQADILEAEQPLSGVVPCLSRRK
jgi:hypothetical protein